MLLPRDMTSLFSSSFKDVEARALMAEIIHSFSTHSAPTCPRHRAWRQAFREAGKSSLPSIVSWSMHSEEILIHLQLMRDHGVEGDSKILPGQIEQCLLTELCLIGSGNSSESFSCICPLAFSPFITQTGKNLPAVQETQLRFLGQEDHLEKEMATHSRILAWSIPWTEGPGRLQSMGSQ